MNKKFTPKDLMSLIKKKIKDRPKPLPLDWHYMVWNENDILMNIRPLWGSRPSHLMEEKMHYHMEQHLVRYRKLPTTDEIMSYLRRDKVLREQIANLFQRKCSTEMTEVDYEVGIRFATSKLADPKVLEAPEMADMVERGTANAGQLIHAFYTPRGDLEEGSQDDR